MTTIIKGTKLEIYETEEDFLNRKDKEICGFLSKNDVDLQSVNLVNCKGCFETYASSDCNNNFYCEENQDCEDAWGCKLSVDCTNIINCTGADGCINCTDLSDALGERDTFPSYYPALRGQAIKMYFKMRGELMR